MADVQFNSYTTEDMPPEITAIFAQADKLRPEWNPMRVIQSLETYEHHLEDTPTLCLGYLVDIHRVRTRIGVVVHSWPDDLPLSPWDQQFDLLSGRINYLLAGAVLERLFSLCKVRVPILFTASLCETLDSMAVSFREGWLDYADAFRDREAQQ